MTANKKQPTDLNQRAAGIVARATSDEPADEATVAEPSVVSARRTKSKASRSHPETDRRTDKTR